MEDRSMSVRVPGAAAILAAVLLTISAGTMAQASWFDCCHLAPARGKMVRTAYPVAEFVIPIPGMESDDCRWWQFDGMFEKRRGTQEGQLIQLIQSTIAPSTWATMGGPGTLDYYPMTMTLVVDQTPDVQEQIADLLAALHREMDTEVALEVRLVSVSTDPLATLTANFGGMQPALDLTSRPLFLSDGDVAKFLQMVQNDQHANVMQTPKITAFNGQRVNLQCTDKQAFVTGIETSRSGELLVVKAKTEEIATGLRMSARPKLSADRQSVNLDLKINLSNLAAEVVPMTKLTMQIDEGMGAPVTFTQLLQKPKVETICIDKKLNIPDGKTVLLGGVKRTVEVRNEFGPPVISRIPYVNRLFKNFGYSREEQTLYVLVTPRIIIADEEREQVGFHCESMPACAERSEVCPPR
jgi:general secretion pathway protein D